MPRGDCLPEEGSTRRRALASRMHAGAFGCERRAQRASDASGVRPCAAIAVWLPSGPQLSKLGIQVYEVVPPAVDTELNPEGRACPAG